MTSVLTARGHMDMMSRIQAALEQQLLRAHSPSAPPRLIAAMRHAVFPGGARIRPQLCIAVARACGDDIPQLTNAAAIAIERAHGEAGTEGAQPSVGGIDQEGPRLAGRAPQPLARRLCARVARAPGRRRGDGG